MAVYKYTLKKYAKSYSTWIIALITLVLIVVGMGVLPFQIFPPLKIRDYIKRVLILIPAITVFLSIFSSIFAGFKSANMFKDEIENGTFLIMISKPIPRHKILVYKWLALQTFLLFYSVFTAFCEAATIMIFDNGDQFTDSISFLGVKTLKDKAFVIFGYTTIILYIMSLTFSSITILLSTRLSVSSSVGIAIAISVVIPITRLVSVFTTKDEIKKVIKKNQLEYINPLEKLEANQIKLYSLLLNSYKKQFQADKKNPASIRKLVDGIDLEKIQQSYQKSIAKLSNDPQRIYEIGSLTGETNSYKTLWPLDTNFQISKLSALVYDEIIPRRFQNNTYLRTSHANYLGNYIRATNKNLLQVGANDPVLEKFNQFVEKTWAITKNIRADFLSLWLALFYFARKEIQNSLNEADKKAAMYNTFSTAYQDFMRAITPPSSTPVPKTPGDNLATKATASGQKASPVEQKIYPLNFKDDFTFYDQFAKLITIVRESKQQTNLDSILKVLALRRFFLVFARNPYLMRWIIKIKNKQIENLLFYLTSMISWILTPLENYSSYGIRNALDDRSIPFKNTDQKLLAKAMNISLASPQKDQGLAQIKFTNASGKPKTYDFTRLYSYYINLEDTNYSKAYYGIYLLLKNGAKFGRYETKEYVSKYTILIIFASVSLALIPLSYLSIRRKDFK